MNFAALSRLRIVPKFTNHQYFSTCQLLREKESSLDLDRPFPIITDDSDNVQLNPNKHRRLLDFPNEIGSDSHQKLLKICILGNYVFMFDTNSN